MTALIILWVLFYLLFPALVIKLCEKVSFFSKIGTILTLYFIGVIVGNLLIFPFPKMATELYGIQDLLTSLTIPLAMPLILFSCNFKHLPIRSASLSLVFGLIAMVIVVITGYYIFSPLSEYPDFKKVAGLLVGVYTGGTPNLAALKMMLGVDEATYLLINSFDMLVSFIYLAFLMAVGVRIARKILPYKMKGTFDESSESSKGELSNRMYHDIFKKENFLPVLCAVGISILIAGISIGISFLITGKICMLVLILALTTLAIIASFIPKIRGIEKSYDVGMYLVLVFSLVVASMVDITQINFREGLWFLLYIVYAIFGSLVIQVILSRIFKIDSDTTVITSVALINSPLFVPMIADVMKNKRAVIVGITAGVIGYAVGNYLGAIISAIL